MWPIAVQMMLARVYEELGAELNQWSRWHDICVGLDIYCAPFSSPLDLKRRELLIRVFGEAWYARLYEDAEQANAILLQALSSQDAMEKLRGQL